MTLYKELGFTRDKDGEICRSVIHVEIIDSPPYPTIEELYLRQYIAFTLPNPPEERQQPRNGGEK